MKKAIPFFIFLAFNNYCVAQTCSVSLLPKDTVICAGRSITLKANATGTAPIQYVWTDFSQAMGQTLVVSPSNTITYYVNINTGNGCVAKDSVKVSVSPKPLASFILAVTDSCSIASQTVQFLNSSTNPSVNYLWNFGDGFSTVSSPAHVYTAEGIYSVQLKAVNVSGCSDSITKVIQVKTFKPIVPAAGFLSLTATSECTTPDGWTNYFNDNNTPSNAADDVLLLSLKKNGNNIGSVGNGNFTLKTTATQGAGSNTAILLTHPLITNPSGFWVMNRYWEVKPTNQPTSPVSVRFYFNTQDLADVNGSFPTHNLTYNNLLFYKTTGGNPDPTTNLNGATRIISIVNASQADSNKWVYTNLLNNRHMAEFKVNSFSGGGGGATSNGLLLPIETAETANTITISPNPANHFIEIHTTIAFKTPFEAALYNSLGQIVYSKRLIQLSDMHLDLPYLKGGYYHLVLRNDSKQMYQKGVIIAQ
jgi:PKD repeat protein